MMTFVWLIICHINIKLIVKAVAKLRSIVSVNFSETIDNEYVQRVLPLASLLLTTIVLHQLFKDVDGVVAQARLAIFVLFFSCATWMLFGALRLFRTATLDQYLFEVRKLNRFAATTIGGAIFFSNLLGAVSGDRGIYEVLWSLALWCSWISMIVLMHRVSRPVWATLISSFIGISLAGLVLEIVR